MSYKFAGDRVKGLKILSTMDIDPKTKAKLREQAKKWIRYIKLHSKEIEHPDDNMYHRGEMSFIEVFFLSDIKKEK